MLGTKPDKEVSILTGHPLPAVKFKREQLGRPKADPILDYWTPEHDRLIGTMPDSEVARQTGRTRVAVQKRRLRLGIEYKRPQRPPWTEQEIALLGTLPDVELARRFQWPVHRVAYKRKALHIPPCRAGRIVRTEADSPSFSASALISQLANPESGAPSRPTGLVSFRTAKIQAPVIPLNHRAEVGTANPPSSPLGTPPDFISIPEHLKSKLVEHLTSKLAGDSRLPTRLNHLLQYAGIRLLGDLDGKCVSDFKEYRGWGEATLLELRRMISRALDSGAKPALGTRRNPGRYWWPAKRTFKVSRVAGGLSLDDLPVSARLQDVLKGLGIERLEQLHGLAIHKVLARSSCGQTTFAELNILLARAEAGEYALSEQALASSTPADLLRQIDDLVNQRPKRARAWLTLYFGDTGVTPHSLRQISERSGVTPSDVSYRLTSAIRAMRRQGSQKLRSLLAFLDRLCNGNNDRISSALASTWRGHTHPFEHSPEFYDGIIARLRSEAGRSGMDGRQRPSK